MNEGTHSQVFATLLNKRASHKKSTETDYFPRNDKIDFLQILIMVGAGVALNTYYFRGTVFPFQKIAFSVSENLHSISIWWENGNSVFP